MNPARKPDMPEPPDDAERDADLERTTILNLLAQQHSEITALRAECNRLMAAYIALLPAPTDAAPADVDDLAPGHPLRFRKIIEALKPTPQWLRIKDAAHRSGCSVARMGQLRKENKVISKRVDGAIFIMTASVDARLLSLGRTPNI
jgi:hypothetical protein